MITIKHKKRTTLLLAVAIMIATAACTAVGTQPQYTPTPLGKTEHQGKIYLEAELSIPGTIPLCDPVELAFEVTNPSAQAVYLLTWYTPLEGILGDIFQVTYAGQELPYLGPQVMRAAPLPEQYILLQAGESATAKVDVATVYDFSNEGRYRIAFKSPQISHLVADASQFAATVDALGPVQISSQPVEVEMIALENGEEDCSASTDASPAASDQDHPDFPLITLTGIVKDVSPSARIIWLQEEVDGFTTLALTADSTITNASGSPLELTLIQQGLTVRASGQPGEHQALLVHSVQVIPPLKPTAITNNGRPTVTSSGPQGYLTFPYQSADAGNFFLGAGEDILITWEQAPQGAESYAFVYTGSDDGVSQTIGIDDDGLDGVTTSMRVPEHLNGQLVGIARLGDGSQIQSLSSSVFSGKLPPANVCSLQANGVGVVNVYREPQMSSPRFAYLTPGSYATVIIKIGNDWYLIDASVAIDTTENTAAQGQGWVNAINSSISLHGSCSELPNGE